MKKRNKAYLLCSSLLGSLFFVTGCTRYKQTSEIEQIVYSILSSDEVTRIEETQSDVTIEGDVLKDVKITLNLDKFSKSIIYDKSLDIITNILSGIDLILENKINNCTILVNSSELDVYGNAQKVKVLEFNIDKDTLDKINFEHFDYLNLDKVAEVKKFKYLTEE